jgi:hypothetical protein
MEYTSKHQNLIAKFFKKVGMPEAAQTILTCPEYDHEIALAMRDASTRTNIPLSTPALLDAVRRYETRHCPIFKECTLSSCDGSVWCSIYNIGGSHGRTGQQYRHLGEHSNLVPVRKRRKIMLEMLEYETGQRALRQGAKPDNKSGKRDNKRDNKKHS